MISFDDEPPKKPKPQLKPRRLSSASKKVSTSSSVGGPGGQDGRKENVPPEVMICIVSVTLFILILRS